MAKEKQIVKKYDQDLCPKHGLPNHPASGKCPMCIASAVEAKEPFGGDKDESTA